MYIDLSPHCGGQSVNPSISVSRPKYFVCTFVLSSPSLLVYPSPLVANYHSRNITPTGITRLLPLYLGYGRDFIHTERTTYTS